MESLKVVSLEVENVKRVRRVDMTFDETGLTVIGGKNAQGKTSLLDAVKWTLGGDRFRPSDPGHEGAQPETKVTLSNGMIAEIHGKNSSLKVTDPSGKRGGITLVQDFIGTFALDLPKFLNSTATDKCKMLMDTFPGLGKKLADLNAEKAKVYQERLTVGREMEKKDKHAKDLPYDESAPEQLLSTSDMAAKLTATLSKNAANKAARDNVLVGKMRAENAAKNVLAKAGRVSEVERMLAEAKDALNHAIAERTGFDEQVKQSERTAADLIDDDVSSVKKEMGEIDVINAKVRQNLEKAHAEDEASTLRVEYNALSDRIEQIDAERVALMDTVKLPLPELAIDDGELIYNGQKWDCMSGAEHLKVGTAICMVLKPSCGFVLLDELEKMDLDTMKEFGEWLVENNMQAIGTRVSRGEECSVIIDDGIVVQVNKKESGFDL